MKQSLKQKSFLFPCEPNWFISRCGIKHTVPHDAASWLYELKSLTGRLRRNCAPCFQVQVLTQSWKKPFTGEAKLLGQPPYHHMLIREVRLECNGTPLIAARTIIPAKTLSGAHRRLSRLGTRPLGEVIFCYPGLKRLGLELVQLEPDNWSPAAIENLSIQGNIWGRRTLYSIGGPKLVVCEFFLPAVLEPRDAKS